MKRIDLTQGQHAIVDDEDYQWLSKWKWYAWWSPSNRSFYAARMSRLANGKRHVVYMHRQILGLEKGDNREGDHINHITLDDRRENLRIVTHRQNQWNRRHPKGYHWYRRTHKFQAYIRLDGKKRHLGYYDVASDAHDAYLTAKELYCKIG